MSSACAPAAASSFDRGQLIHIPQLATSPGGTVLVVDDDPWFRLLVQALLKQTSYRIFEAASGHDGISLLGQSPFDIAMVDIMMPDQSGLATIQAARDKFRDLKILAVSGAADKAYFLRAAEMVGADAALEKPLSKRHLLEALQRLAQ